MEYLEINIATLRIPGTDKSGNAKAVITQELHIVNKLEANILTGTDIMLPKKMDISFLLEARYGSLRLVITATHNAWLHPKRLERDKRFRILLVHLIV
jgi:hypothetical protein